MSCILYSLKSYKHLFNSPCIKEVIQDISVPFSAFTLYALNKAAYIARYPKLKSEDFLEGSHELPDDKFIETDMTNPIAVFKLLSRIDYQLIDIKLDTGVYNKYLDDYDTFQVIRLTLVDQIIFEAENYRRLYLKICDGSAYDQIVHRAAELSKANKG